MSIEGKNSTLFFIILFESIVCRNKKYYPKILLKDMNIKSFF